MHKSSSEPVFSNGMYRRTSLSPQRDHKHDPKEERQPLLSKPVAHETIVLLDENQASKPQRRILDVIVVFLVLLFAESARGIVLPTLAPFVTFLGGTAVLLGYAVAAFSVGRFASTIGLGWLSTRLSYKTVLGWSVFICVLGNALYCFSAVLGVYALLVSRFITGFGAGTLSVARAYIAHVTLPKERTSYMSILGAVQFLGFAITPGVGSVLAFLPPFELLGLPVDKFTYPGWFLTVTNGIVLAILVFAFQNPPKEVKEVSTTIGPNAPVVVSAEPVVVTPPRRSFEMIKAFGVFLTLNLLVRLVLGILETLGTPMYIAVWNNDESKANEAGFVFAGMGLIGVGVLFFISYISKFISDFIVLVVGLVTLTLGCGLLIGNHLSLARFLIGAGLIWCIGFPLAQTIIVSMFSKMLGKQAQGTWMGWIGAMGSLGRIVGPIGAGYLYDHFGQAYAMGFGAAMSLISLITVLLIIPKKKVPVIIQ
jgi:ceroid-lipofuscinosis MFS transporter 7